MRRVGMEIPVSQVARACEVNPNVLRRWRREGRQFGAEQSDGPCPRMMVRRYCLFTWRLATSHCLAQICIQTRARSETAVDGPGQFRAFCAV